MGKAKELEMTIDAIIEAGEEMLSSYKKTTAAAERIVSELKTLKDLFTERTPEVEEEPKTKEPNKEEVDSYSFDQVREFLSGLSGNGKFQEVKELLTKFGVKRLSAIKPEDYPALMKEAKEIANA